MLNWNTLSVSGFKITFFFLFFNWNIHLVTLYLYLIELPFYSFELFLMFAVFNCCGKFPNFGIHDLGNCKLNLTRNERLFKSVEQSMNLSLVNYLNIAVDLIDGVHRIFKFDFLFISAESLTARPAGNTRGGMNISNPEKLLHTKTW